MEYWSVIFRLEKVGDLRRTEREIDDQIALCRLRALPGSPVLSDMPKTHTNAVHGLDDFYVDAERFFKAKKRIETQIKVAVEEAEGLMEYAGTDYSREVMRMYYLGGMTKAEIAEQTGKTVRCISMLILRGARRIAENYDMVA